MTSRFVSSGTGDNTTGLSWSTAYTTIYKDWGPIVSDGDVVYIKDDHSETPSTPTLTGVTVGGTLSPVDIRCVVGAATGTTPGNLSTGAFCSSAAGTTLSIVEGVNVYGVTFETGASGDHIFIYNNTNYSTFDNCTFVVRKAGEGFYLSNTDGILATMRFIDCTINFAGGSSSNLRVRGGFIEFVNGTWSTNVTSGMMLEVSNGHWKAYFRGMDLSAQSSAGFPIANVNASNIEICLEGCELHASFALVSGTVVSPGTVIAMRNCESGTGTDPGFDAEKQTRGGILTIDTGIYLTTGGASDGERSTALAWKIVTSAGKTAYPYETFETFPIYGWTDGDGSTSHVYRIYFNGSASLDDKDIWFELTGPTDDAGSSTSTAKLEMRSNRALLEASDNGGWAAGPAWTGVAATDQQMDITYTPDKPGPLCAIVHIAASATVYVNPHIVVDP